MRAGRYAVGIDHVKTGVNVGTLMRSAFVFGASLVFTVGRRYTRQASDTLGTPSHVPIMHFPDWGAAWESLPLGWVPVGVELADGARPLAAYEHPQNATYILGPEDGSLSRSVIERCRDVVVIPGRHCLNVATAGSIVMAHRVMQRGAREECAA